MLRRVQAGTLGTWTRDEEVNLEKDIWKTKEVAREDNTWRWQGLEKGMRCGKDKSVKDWRTVAYWAIKTSGVIDEETGEKPERGPRSWLLHGCQMALPPPALHPCSREEAASDKEEALEPISEKQNFPKSPADRLRYLVFGIDGSQNICLIISLAESKHFYFCIVHVEKEKSAISQTGIQFRKTMPSITVFCYQSKKLSSQTTGQNSILFEYHFHKTWDNL